MLLQHHEDMLEERVKDEEITNKRRRLPFCAACSAQKKMRKRKRKNRKKRRRRKRKKKRKEATQTEEATPEHAER